MSLLTGDDLARPAKDLPLKVIRALGHMLHRAQYTSGDWEMIAEDLGYGYEEIKHFTTLASVKQEVAPGELMLRDWVQRTNGRTLFVLHSALVKAERLDCVEYLESEIYKRIVCMDLMVCVRHEHRRSSAGHLCVTTHAESNLMDSLQNALEQPVEEKYQLLDSGISWTGTLAREFKGRQVMLLRKFNAASMEQDPTVDSSGIDMPRNDDSTSVPSQSSLNATFITTSPGSPVTSNVGTSLALATCSNLRPSQISTTKSNVGTNQISARSMHTNTSQTPAASLPPSTRQSGTTSSLLGTNQVQMMPSSQNPPYLRRNTGIESHIYFQSSRQKANVAENISLAYGDSHQKGMTNHIKEPVPPGRMNEPRSHSIQEPSPFGSSTHTIVNTLGSSAPNVLEQNNLNCVPKKGNLKSLQNTMNILAEDKKADNLEIVPKRFSEDISDTRRKREHTEKKAPEKVTEDHDSTQMEFINAHAVDENMDIDSSEYRDYGEYRDPSGYRDPSEYKDPSKYREPRTYLDQSEYKDFSEYRDVGEYRDPCEYRAPCEYRDPDQLGDLKRDHNAEVNDALMEVGIQKDDKSLNLNKCVVIDELRDVAEYSGFDEYRNPSDWDSIEYKDFWDNVGIEGRKNYVKPINDSSVYSSFALQDRDSKTIRHYKKSNERKHCNQVDPCKDMDMEHLEPFDNEDRFISEGFETAQILLTSGDFVETSVVEPNVGEEVTKKSVKEMDSDFETAEYRGTAEVSNCSDDSITYLKQKLCSKDSFIRAANVDLDGQTAIKENESQLECNVNDHCSNENTQSDFESDTYNTQPEFDRDIDDVNTAHIDSETEGVYNGNGAFMDQDHPEALEETRIYLDFNKYDQGKAHNGEESAEEERSEELGVKTEMERQNTLHVSKLRAQHRPPMRFISEAPGTSMERARDRQKYLYESLQRGQSCPSDILYQKSVTFSDESEMITIADVFSPITEESKIGDFGQAVSFGELQATGSSDSLDSLASKRHSLPTVRPGENVKRSKLQRHTFHHGENIVQLKDRFEQELPWTMKDSPPLPPRGRLSNLYSYAAETTPRPERSNFDISAGLSMVPAENRGVASGHCCKIVIGGKSSRPHLDNLIANDKLFTHYNTVLQEFPGWSSRETENTVEKTMAGALSSDGYYLLWYVRSRKNLVISVSFRGQLVNYRVHTKVLDGILHYYVTQGRYFEDVLQLIHHYVQNGVRAPGSVSGNRISLRCPVIVQYERRPAVSV